MNLFEDVWATDSPVGGRQREVLYILMRSAGFHVHPGLLSYYDVEAAMPCYLCGFGNGYVYRTVKQHVDAGMLHLSPTYEIKYKLSAEELTEYFVKTIKDGHS